MLEKIEKFVLRSNKIEDSLEKELKYCKQLIDVIKGNEEICSYPKVQEKLKSTRRICH